MQMPNSTYLPSTEAGLLAWATAFNTQINATPTDFGLTIAQAAERQAAKQK